MFCAWKVGRGKAVITSQTLGRRGAADGPALLFVVLSLSMCGGVAVADKCYHLTSTTNASVSRREAATDALAYLCVRFVYG